MTETGRDVVERLRNGELTVTRWTPEDEYHAHGEDAPEIAAQIAAVVEAAQNHRSHWPKSPSMTGRKLDEALAALHSQASDEGKPAE